MFAYMWIWYHEEWSSVNNNLRISELYGRPRPKERTEERRTAMNIIVAIMTAIMGLCAAVRLA